MRVRRIVTSLVVVLCVGRAAWALDGAAGDPAAKTTAATQQNIFETIYGDSSKLQFVMKEKSLYMNLRREIERNQRDQTAAAEVATLTNEWKQLAQELDKLRESLDKKVAQKTEANENLKLMISLYQAIKPDEAAQMLKRMPLSVSLATMHMMSPRQASKVLAAMDPKFAAEVSRRLIQNNEEAKGGPP